MLELVLSILYFRRQESFQRSTVFSVLFFHFSLETKRSIVRVGLCCRTAGTGRLGDLSTRTVSFLVVYNFLFGVGEALSFGLLFGSGIVDRLLGFLFLENVFQVFMLK